MAVEQEVEQKVESEKEWNTTLNTWKSTDTTDSLKKTITDLEGQVEKLQLEVEALRKDVEISRFALERFSNSSEDIVFYTGFPDYKTLTIFWEKIMPCASNLTRWNYARRKTGDKLSDTFPHLSNLQVGDGEGRPRKLKQIDEFFWF